MKKLLSFLFCSILVFSTSSFASKNYLKDYAGEWVLNKQTNCEDPILALTIKKNRIKAGELKGKINIKKNSLKLGKDLTGTLSSYFSIQLSSETSECVYEFIKEHPVYEFAKSPLRDLKVPDNWQLFNDPEELYKFHDFFKGPVHEKNPIRWWDMKNYVDDCERATSEFDTDVIEVEEDMGLPRYYIRCKTVFTHKHFRDRDEGIKVFERILLSWAKTKPVIYRGFSSKQKTPKDNNGSYSDQAYASSMLIGDFASFYAVYYNDFNFTSKQRQSVDGYLSDWLINHDLEPEPGKKRCPFEKPKKWERKGYEFDGDHCGSNRWRIGLGAIYLGLRTGNQKLFTAGNRHIEINLAATDKDGIFLQWARKGAMALSYQRQLPEVLTLLAVAYESIGYDFYEHQLPHGKKIHEVYETFFDFIYLPEKLNKYASTRPKYAGTDLNSFNKLPLSEKWEREYIYPEVLAAQSKGYVLRYRPDLMDKIDYTKTWDIRWADHISNFVNISGLAIYEAANQNVSKLIAKRIEAVSELSIFELEDKTFNLKVDKVYFNENIPFELERDKKYLQPYQLHKAFIQGFLKSKNYGSENIFFSTLVFKQADTQEQRLVIHVDDQTVEPLKRHSDSLQKKCGSELMNEWGWLSFISKTNDTEKASEQQCHYDYFKEANDKEAWELFQTVLGGTNSILDYLETNVEL